jgi:protein-S-isoprenylcysteine O-methyltransferase Ste14
MLIMSEKTDFILRFILFAAAHSLFAAASVKEFFHGAGRQGYRLCYNMASLAMFGWVMSAYRHSDVLYFVPGIWSLIMYLLQLVVAVILVVCLKQTGIGAFFGFAKRTSSSFTSSGWYSTVRHPLYSFSTLFMVLNPVMTSQWLMLTIMATAYFIVGALVEEKRHIVEFGDEYLRYQQRVPFFVPNIAKPRP